MTVYYTGNGSFMTADELYHYGVPGMKWGKRKAQQYEARAQRNRTMASMNRAAAGKSSGLISKANTINANYYQKKADKLSAKADKIRNQNSPEAKAARKAKVVKAAKIGAAVAGTALAAYGAYKLTKFVKDKNVEIATQKGEALAKQYIKENKYTVGRDGLGGIVAMQNGQAVGRAFGNRTDAEMRNAARAYAGLNRVNYNNAQAIKSRTIRDATRDSLGTAAKNVSSHYADKAKTAVASSKVGKSVSSMKLKAEATRAVNKAAKEARERARDEYIKRATASVASRNTRRY